MSIEKVAILGGGLMGSGIAESTAVAGLSVIVRDIDDTAIGGARRRIEKSLGAAVERGKVDVGPGQAEELRDPKAGEEGGLHLEAAGGRLGPV